MGNLQPEPLEFHIGRRTEAKYSTLEDEMGYSNPYLEALGDIEDDDIIIRKLTKRPKYDDLLRKHAPSRRTDYINRLTFFTQPTVEYLELAALFWQRIKQGYLFRNPIDSFYIQQMRKAFEDADFHLKNGTLQSIPQAIPGLAIIGPSGVGKTLTTNSVLSLFPQVITHTQYKNEPFIKSQVVWIKFNAPPGGSPKGICRRFSQAVDMVLGTNYSKKLERIPKDRALDEMALTAQRLGLGLLVIDEVQRIRADREGENTLIEFFTDLIDKMAIPIILVGTYKMQPILNTLANSRRFPAFYWNPLKGSDWEEWLSSLWTYQFTNVKTPLTNKLSEAMFEESQGIADIAVKLYMFVQWEIIGANNEKITPKRIREAAKRYLQCIQPMMDALRTKDPYRLSKYPDIYPALPDQVMIGAYQAAKERVVKVNLNTNSKKSEIETDVQSELNLWLIEELGISLEDAAVIALDAINGVPVGSDVKILKKQAAKIALSRLEVEREKDKTNEINAGKIAADTSGLLVTSEDTKDKPAYDVLTDRGLIKGVGEFIE